MKRKTFKKLEKKAKSYANIIANHIFVDHVHKRSLDEVCERINRYNREIKKLRDFLELDCKRLLKENAFINEQGLKYTPEFEPDRRTGEETYGYKSLESVETNLDYISDRFSAEFRLSWLLDVPEKVELLKAKQ